MSERANVWLFWACCSILGIGLGLLVPTSCFMPAGRAEHVAGDQVAAGVVVRAELEAALARIETLQAEVTAIKTGDIRLGGEGGTITGFIYSLIAGAAVVSSLAHQVVIRPIWRRWFLHCILRAASRACWTAGNSNATRIPMMAITTNSSTSVKPSRFS